MSETAIAKLLLWEYIMQNDNFVKQSDDLLQLRGMQMNLEEKKIVDISGIFKIEAYQRGYRWGKDEVEYS